MFFTLILWLGDELCRTSLSPLGGSGFFEPSSNFELLPLIKAFTAESS